MISQRLSIARPYALALFNAAVTTNSVAEIGDLLQQLVKLCSVPSVKSALCNTTIDVTKRITICIQLSETTSSIGKTFIEILISSKRLHVLNELSTIYRQFVDEKENRVRVLLRSAHPLSKNNKEQLRVALAPYIANKKAVFEYSEDRSLIGGLEARIGDTVIYGSLKNIFERVAI